MFRRYDRITVVISNLVISVMVVSDEFTWGTCCFTKIICRYASLYFCMCIDPDDNELEILEIIHHFVEILDRYFGSVSHLSFLVFNIPIYHQTCALHGFLPSFSPLQVCELDLIFNFHKVLLFYFLQLTYFASFILFFILT